VIVFTYASDLDFTPESLEGLYSTLSRMGREGSQGEIGVVIDGKYYGITEFAEV